MDYIERFTQEKQLAKTQLGKHFLDVFVGNTTEYRDLTEKADQKEMKNKAFEQFMVILFLRASDQRIYGSMQDEYCMDFANKKDNYPKTVTDMVDVMRQVKVRKKTSPSDEEKSKKKSTEAVKQEKSFAQNKGDGIICNVCGKPGELASNCPLKQEIAMKNWFVKTGKVLYKENHAQEATVEADEIDKLQIEQNSHNRIGWCIHQDVELISDEDSNKSVSVSYWDTTDDYFSESDNDSLPNLLIRGLVDSDDDDSSIESMGDDYLSNESDDDFSATREFLAQEKKQEVIRKHLEEVILDNGMNISIFNDACLAKNTRKKII